MDSTGEDAPTPSPTPGGGEPPPSPAGPARWLRRLLATPRGKVVAVVTVLAVLAGGGAIVLTGGSSDAAPPITTTTTTTTTTAPPPPPPPPPVYPLTGLPVVDPAVAARPTLVVKIDNAEPKARPQIGLNQADLVYEERVEGAVTRFMAVFHSGDAIPVGPVRSARTSDIGLFKQFGTPLFAWSGANAIFAQRIRDAGIVDIGYDAAPGYYSRAGDRRAPHNLMLDGTPGIWSSAPPGATPPPQLFTYRDPGEAPAGGTPTNGVHITFAQGPGSAPVEYRWNGTGWARSQAGTPHVDAEGAQTAPENVIVAYTPYADSDTNDQFGVPIREAQLVGEGEALVLTGGQAIAARWVKPSLEAPTQYLDASGAPVRLTPGRTWVALPEPGTTVFLP